MSDFLTRIDKEILNLSDSILKLSDSKNGNYNYRLTLDNIENLKDLRENYIAYNSKLSVKIKKIFNKEDPVNKTFEEELEKCLSRRSVIQIKNCSKCKCSSCKLDCKFNSCFNCNYETFTLACDYENYQAYTDNSKQCLRNETLDRDEVYSLIAYLKELDKDKVYMYLKGDRDCDNVCNSQLIEYKLHSDGREEFFPLDSEEIDRIYGVLVNLNVEEGD